MCALIEYTCSYAETFGSLIAITLRLGSPNSLILNIQLVRVTCDLQKYLLVIVTYTLHEIVLKQYSINTFNVIINQLNQDLSVLIFNLLIRIGSYHCKLDIWMAFFTKHENKKKKKKNNYIKQKYAINLLATLRGVGI